ncbi:MAG: PilN domain-containing protein [Phycisphaerales bacterium]|nr:PilN domain-containing protein [Phycisphaerales bacterium]
MTQSNANKTAGTVKRPTKAAGIARAGEKLALVVLRLGKAGEQPLVIESFRTIEVSGKTGAAGRGAGKGESPAGDLIVGVLPGASCTWRSLPTGSIDPEAPPEALSGALALLSEAHAGTVPPHRRAAGLVRTSEGSAGAAGVASWVQDHADRVATLDAVGEVNSYIPAQVALAWAMRVTGRASGIGAWIEGPIGHGAGTIVLCATGEEQNPVLRVLRDDAGDEAAWRTSVREAMLDTAESLGVQAPSLPDGALRDVLVVSPARSGVSPIVGGIPAQSGWIETYALALGAAAAALKADASEAPLHAMTFDPPGSKGNPFERLIIWLATPARCAAAIIILLVIAVLVPLWAAYARWSIIEHKAQGPGAPDPALFTTAREADAYAFQLQRRWPMSKVLAEIVGTAPKGVQIESVTLDVNKPLQITGTADTIETVTEWRAKLGTSVVFEDAKATPNNTAQGTVRFELTAKVAKPAFAMNADAATLAKVNKTAAESATTASGETTSTGRNSNSGRNNTNQTGRRNSNNNESNRGRTDRNTSPPGGGGGGGGGNGGGGMTPAPAETTKTAAAPPSPISDEQIAKLDRTSAMREFTTRRAASQQPGLDESTKQRLRDEAAKCQQRMREASSGGQS